jgi:chromosome segregation ATPase
MEMNKVTRYWNDARTLNENPAGIFVLYKDYETLKQRIKELEQNEAHDKEVNTRLRSQVQTLSKSLRSVEAFWATKLAACEKERDEWEQSFHNENASHAETMEQLAASQHYAQQLRKALAELRMALNTDDWIGEVRMVDFIDSAIGDESTRRAQLKIPEGWQLVPKYPTSRMERAGVGAEADSCGIASQIYRAMLAAAPDYIN